MQIATKGVRYLGSAVGDRDFSRSFLDQKVDEWLEELKVLAKFAQTEPHAAFTALTHGLRGRYTYLLRTMPDTAASVKRVDDFFEQDLLPALSYKKFFTSNDMHLLRLPARLGGLGLPSLAEAATFELQASKKMTGAQVDEILLQNTPHPVESVEKVHVAAVHARNTAKQERRKSAKDKLEELKQTPGVDKRQLELLSTKGASAWLTTLPLRRHGCWLSKRDFQDALALQYNWSLDGMPVRCVCGSSLSPDHALICPFGGYPTFRHNEIRDLLGVLLSDVCHNVAVEPRLTPLSGEVFCHRSANTSPEARLDVRACGFWTHHEDAFFDVRVFHPNAESYRMSTLEELFRRHERQKQLQYEERVTNVKHGSFCPLVFSTTGTAGPLCDRFLKRLASLLTSENPGCYSSTWCWIGCRISLALIRSSVMCIRGSRSRQGKPVHEGVDICVAESRLSVAPQ